MEIYVIFYAIYIFFQNFSISIHNYFINLSRIVRSVDFTATLRRNIKIYIYDSSYINCCGGKA